MRALITGGLGYVGRAAAIEFVSAGWSVTALSRTTARTSGPVPDGVDLAVGDVRDQQRMAELIADGNFDAVVHLAGKVNVGESKQIPLDYYDVNVGGTVCLLRALAQLPAERRVPQVIYGSTTLVYGSEIDGAVDEATPVHPESPYARTKVVTEDLLRDEAALGDVAVTVLRIFNVAGAVGGAIDPDTTRLVPRLLEVAAGRLPSATVVGDGSAVRDFVHVADVATAIRTAAERTDAKGYSVYNVGSGVGSSVMEVLHAVEQVTGRTIPIERMPAQGFPGHVRADISAAEADLGWTPKHSALERIVADAWQVQRPADA